MAPLPQSRDGAYSPRERLRLETPELLLTGGDSRSRIDPLTGVTRYGTTAWPRPATLSLGTCTASSPTDRGVRAAAVAHERLRSATSPVVYDAMLECLYADIRAQVRSLLTEHQVPGTQVVIAPSGTDAELFVLALAQGDMRLPVTNIVVGPNEVGGGTTLAAAGRYFDCETPLADNLELPPVAPGEWIDAACGARTQVVAVPIRNSWGDLISAASLNEKILTALSDGLHQSARVILHIVAHSKTGIRAPDLAFVQRCVERCGERLLVVVDAAQGRVANGFLIDCLRRGFLIIHSGSKFFGGPPFCAAVLVPPNRSPIHMGLTRFPSGFERFFSPQQLPRNWSSLRASVPAGRNPGLALRWVAALAEMRAYFELPAFERQWLACEFAAIARSAFAATRNVELQAVPEEPRFRGWHTHAVATNSRTEAPTVFTIRLHRQSDRTDLDREALHRVQEWLLAGEPPLPVHANDIQMSSWRRFHLGQPLDLSAESCGGRAVLRFALGSPLVTELARMRGRNRPSQDLYPRTQPPEDGLRWIDRELRELRRQLEWIATLPASCWNTTDRFEQRRVA